MREVSFEIGYAYLENFLAVHFIGEKKLAAEKLMRRVLERRPATQDGIIPVDDLAEYDPPSWKKSTIREIILAKEKLPSGQRST